MITEERDFIKTITLLMRLTHDGKIHWSKASAEQIENYSLAKNNFPIYAAKHQDLDFFLEGARLSEEIDTMALPRWQYRLVVIDQKDSAKIVSPPMKAVGDLVALIENPPTRRKLNDINRRLAES